MADERPVRVGSRTGTPPFDWQNRDTWAAAVNGVDALYLVYTPDLAFPGAADDVAAFTKVAVDSGVTRIVLLSGRGEAQAEVSERTVQQSGVDWTVLRCSWFSQNFSESFLLDTVLEGVIALPAGSVAEPFLDADDIADCAFAALTDDRHSGHLYELTGPQALTFAEVAEQLSVATGRPIEYVPITREEYVQGAIDAGLHPDEANAFAGLFSEVLDGRNSSTHDGVRQVLGRPARTFAGFAERASSTGAWTTNELQDAR